MTSWPVDRRALLAAVVQTLAAAPLAPAQTAPRAARIGFLSASSPADARTKGFVDALRQGLRELGWVEGQNLVIEYRWADDRTERLAALADGLSKLRLDVVLVATTPAFRPPRLQCARFRSSWRTPATRWRPASSRASAGPGGTSLGSR